MSKSCETCSNCVERKQEIPTKVNKLCTNWQGSGQVQFLTDNAGCNQYTPKSGG